MIFIYLKKNRSSNKFKKNPNLLKYVYKSKIGYFQDFAIIILL